MVFEMNAGAFRDAEAAFDWAAELGLRGVLLPLRVLGAEPSELAEGEVARWRLAASRTGVAIAGLTGVMTGVEHRLAGGDTSRAAALARLRAAIRLCTELGAKLACFEMPAWETLRGRLRPDQARTLAADVVRCCGPLAESRRVTLCVSGGEAVSAEEFVRKVDHPNVRLGCDAATLRQLAQPERDVRLVRTTPGDDPKLLGKLLGSLGYGHWLALRPAGSDGDTATARAWLKTLRASAGAMAGE